MPRFMEFPFTTEQVQNALEQSLSRQQLKAYHLNVLQLQYSFPDKTVTALELAYAAGYEHHQNMNRLYGGIGHILAEYLDPDEKAAPDQYSSRKRSTRSWYSYLSEGKNSPKGYLWIMWLPVAQALENLGVVELGEENLIPNEVRTSFPEGAVHRIAVDAYERNPRARRICVNYFGLKCAVCGFDFGEIYGDVGKGIIHVHHLKPLSEIGKEYEVDPIEDLRPVCPNCHTIIHRRQPPYTIEEVQAMLRQR